MRLLTAISIASLVVSIAAVVFVLGLYAELEKRVPDYSLTSEKSESKAAPSEIAVLDEETVISLVVTYIYHSDSSDGTDSLFNVCMQNLSGAFNEDTLPYSATFVGKDLWVVTTDEGYVSKLCAFTVNDATGKVTENIPGRN